MKYRAEIDGLRAVAVLPVIFFHAGFYGFSGGYVGVDVFFVISGYLITSIIVEEYEIKGSFSLAGFYERRVRRILPALSVVLLATTLLAFVFMPANLLASYSRSLISVVTFTSNFFFYLTSGYFATASDEKPLLHLWSLAVEEQYYLFFPLIMWLLWFVGRTSIMVFLLTLTCSSFLLAQYLSSHDMGNASFYFIFSRAWELLVGSLIALIGVEVIKGKLGRTEIFSFIGLLLILYAVFFFDSETPYPSIYTLIPVLGTLFIIIFCDEETLLGKLLSNWLFVWVGLISYSLYLWHQPLFAFLRIKTLGEPHIIGFILAIALSLFLSYVTYKLVERPFRDRVLLSSKKVIVFSFISTVLFASVGVVGHINAGFELRFTNPYTSTIKYSPKRHECHNKWKNHRKPSNACRYGGERITWAAFGDSHVIEPAFALSQLLKLNNEGLVHLSSSGCPAALNFETKRPGCHEWIKESVRFLESDKEIKNILMAFRYSAFLFGDQLAAYPDIPNKSAARGIVGSADLDAKKARQMYWDSLYETIMRLRQSGKNVYVIYPIPELPTHISQAVIPFSIFGGPTKFDLSKMTSIDYYQRRNKFIIDKLNTLDYGEGLYAIKPADVFCDEQYCSAVDRDKALYFDDDHLSLYGAKKLLIKSGVPR